MRHGSRSSHSNPKINAAYQRILQLRQEHVRVRRLLFGARDAAAVRRAASVVNVNARWFQAPYRSALHEAPNEEVVRALLDAGASVNARDNNGLTPLHCARNAAIVRLLLTRGASMDARDLNIGYTPLHCACDVHNVGVARALLDAGSYVNATDRMLRTPLHYFTANNAF